MPTAPHHFLALWRIAGSRFCTCLRLSMNAFASSLVTSPFASSRCCSSMSSVFRSWCHTMQNVSVLPVYIGHGNYSSPCSKYLFHKIQTNIGNTDFARSREVETQETHRLTDVDLTHKIFHPNGVYIMVRTSGNACDKDCARPNDGQACLELFPAGGVRSDSNVCSSAPHSLPRIFVVRH